MTSGVTEDSTKPSGLGSSSDKAAISMLRIISFFDKPKVEEESSKPSSEGCEGQVVSDEDEWLELPLI